MDENLRLRIEEFAKNYCSKDLEDPQLWENHVVLVRDFALKLAKIENADEDVVEIAALLHDIGTHLGRENHNEKSHDLAKLFLEEVNLPEDKKKLILKCIFKHSSRFAHEDNELEVKVIQSADALGVLFSEPWQKACRESMENEEILALYDKTFKKINLESAREIARLQIEELKNLFI